MMKKFFITTLIYIVTITSAVGLYAQDAAAPVGSTPASNIFKFTYENIFFVFAAIVLLGVIIAGINLVWALIESQKLQLLDKYGPEAMDTANLETSTSIWSSITKKAWNIVPQDKEGDIELSHEYDGIRELDNSLPPWWLWLFYGTIIWSAVYLWYYQVSGKGPNQEQEYISAMEIGEAEKAKHLSSQANAVDEKTVTLLTDAASIAEGKEIFATTTCITCHGEKGEGNAVGPNLTDKYWLHGGSINDVFKTIKYGVPDKGMISWQAQINPASMQKVSSYILSLQGSNPPNPKAPQGELYEGAPTSATVTTDNTTTAKSPTADSTATKK